jgi:hypothetical protein
VPSVRPVRVVEMLSAWWRKHSPAIVEPRTASKRMRGKTDAGAGNADRRHAVGRGADITLDAEHPAIDLDS